MLNKEYCGRCENVIEPTNVFYVYRTSWEKWLKRRGWRWTQLGWTCPECASLLRTEKTKVGARLTTYDVRG